MRGVPVLFSISEKPPDLAGKVKQLCVRERAKRAMIETRGRNPKKETDRLLAAVNETVIQRFPGVFSV